MHSHVVQLISVSALYKSWIVLNNADLSENVKMPANTRQYSNMDE